MSRLVVAGAGPIGAGVVHLLARRELFSDIVVVDEQATIASGLSLDLLQSGPVEGFDTRIEATADPGRAAGAAAIVLADRVGSPPVEWQGEPALSLVDRLVAASPLAVVVCAGAMQWWVLERIGAELTAPAERVVGSAPLALEAAFRSLVALEADASALDVHVPLAGRPPDQITVAWDRATIGRTAALDRLPLAATRRLERLLPKLWPPGPIALASAAAAVTAAACTGSRRALPCFAIARSPGGVLVEMREVRVGPRGLEAPPRVR
jgi:malate dehydrogenase